MEHSCPPCHSSVDDSSPFCPSCGAAQVHFSGRQLSDERILITSSGNGSPVLLDQTHLAAAEPGTVGSHPALRASIYGGLIAALLCLIPLGPIFIFALPLGGFFSILFFRRFAYGISPPPRAGFKLGALAGVFSFLLLLIFVALGTLVPNAGNELRDAMLQNLRQMEARATDPQATQMLDYFMSAQGMAILIVVGFVFMAITFVVLSGLGAAISASLLRRKTPPEQ